MSNQASLLHEVLHCPEDLALRQVYADWLEDHGDARAEIIRLECDLAQTSKDDLRCAEREAHEARLVEEHGAVWFGPLMRLVNAAFPLNASGIAWLLFLHREIPLPGAKVVPGGTSWRGEVEQDGRIFPTLMRVFRRRGNVIEGDMRCKFDVDRFGRFSYDGVVIGPYVAFVTDRKSGTVSYPGLYIGRIEEETIKGWWQVPCYFQKGEFSFSRR
jgi:uncharacterized protein (TIGR02996 family)